MQLMWIKPHKITSIQQQFPLLQVYKFYRKNGENIPTSFTELQINKLTKGSYYIVIDKRHDWLFPDWIYD